MRGIIRHRGSANHEQHWKWMSPGNRYFTSYRFHNVGQLRQSAQGFPDYGGKLIRRKRLKQKWSARLLHETLSIITYYISGGKYYPIQQPWISILNILIKLLTIHHWCPDINQAKVIALFPQQVISYLSIDSNIHLKAFTGKNSTANLSDSRFIFNYQDFLFERHRSYSLAPPSLPVSTEIDSSTTKVAPSPNSLLTCTLPPC